MNSRLRFVYGVFGADNGAGSRGQQFVVKWSGWIRRTRHLYAVERSP